MRKSLLFRKNEGKGVILHMKMKDFLRITQILKEKITPIR